ncbi:MAG: riboflavin synthase [Planctomycetota bacterium]
MFTGLVEACVPIRSWRVRGTGGVLTVPAPAIPAGEGEPWTAAPKESVAVSGCCLTVAALEPDRAMVFELSAETIACTWFGELVPGRVVNLERAVRLADRLGGHLVSGHVDGRARIAAIADAGDGGKLFTFAASPDFARYLVLKGSVGVDGISLTVVAPRGSTFDVAVIPETLRRTSLGTARVGQRVHLEADMIGKWVERLLEARGGAGVRQ